MTKHEAKGATGKVAKSETDWRAQLSPDEYRVKWNLPKDYPMVAPNYAEKRRVLAKEIGLGTKGRGGGRKPIGKGGKAPIQRRRPQ